MIVHRRFYAGAALGWKDLANLVPVADGAEWPARIDCEHCGAHLRLEEQQARLVGLKSRIVVPT
jgi:hypothetical protein